LCNVVAISFLIRTIIWIRFSIRIFLEPIATNHSSGKDLVQPIATNPSSAKDFGTYTDESFVGNVVLFWPFCHKLLLELSLFRQAYNCCLS
jgi:hypothetical protein